MEKLGKIDIEYEQGYLYFVKKYPDGVYVCRAKMSRGGRGKKK